MSESNDNGNDDASSILQKEMAETWQWRLETDPELAASLGLLSRRRSSHALDPRSIDSFHKRLLWIEHALIRIHDKMRQKNKSNKNNNNNRTRVNEDALLSEEDQLSYKLYTAQLTDYIAYTKKHRGYLCCVNRLEGPQTDLPLYARYLPTNTRADREFYRNFLKAVPVQIGEVAELLRLGLQEGRTPPRVSLDGVVNQIRGMVDGKMEAFAKPIGNCFVLPQEEELQNECNDLIHGPEGISDAFSSLATFLEKEYIPNLREDISAETGYPNGKIYYQDCLAFHTTTDMTPEEIHRLGLDEVERMRKSMLDIAAQAGYKDRLDEYMNHLRTSKKYEPQSARALCAHYRDITGRVQPELLKLFHPKTLPRLPFAIVETPSASASMAPAAYYLAGSAESTGNCPRPGTFYVNCSEISTRRTYECEALALHEAIPGHHTQASIQGENELLPDFRRYAEDRRYFEAPCRFPFYTGYIEGWGLHCETLGKDLGLYNDPSDRMGQLSCEALRACRLVVDTGMHSLGWSLDKAHKYMIENTAMGEHDARTEVIRYVTWPGQATAYKVGERFIHRLKEKAQNALGSSFDQRDFYHVVLTAGPVPLDTLEDLINVYIKTALGGSEIKSANVKLSPDQTFMETMTFANWCKCCVVPGTCA